MDNNLSINTENLQKISKELSDTAESFISDIETNEQSLQDKFNMVNEKLNNMTPEERAEFEEKYAEFKNQLNSYVKNQQQDDEPKTM